VPYSAGGTHLLPVCGPINLEQHLLQPLVTEGGADFFTVGCTPHHTTPHHTAQHNITLRHLFPRIQSHSPPTTPIHTQYPAFRVLSVTLLRGISSPQLMPSGASPTGSMKRIFLSG